MRHDHDVRAARQLLEHLLAEQRVVDADVRGAVDHVGQPDPVQLLRARVGQQQPDRQPGQDARQLVADVPEAEHGDDRPDRERLEQQADDAAAALAAVLGPGVRAELDLAHLRFARPGLDQLPGPGDGGRLQVAAADAAPGAVAADHHLGAGLARRVAAHLGHGHQHAGLTVVPQLLGGPEPVHRQTSA